MLRGEIRDGDEGENSDSKSVKWVEKTKPDKEQRKPSKCENPGERAGKGHRAGLKDRVCKRGAQRDGGNTNNKRLKLEWGGGRAVYATLTACRCCR